MKYTELQVTSNFSFLRGASHPHELVEEAKALGYTEIGITDRNTLAGIVRAHTTARNLGIKIIVGCRLDLIDGSSLLAYPTNITAYSRLTNLLTVRKFKNRKGKMSFIQRRCLPIFYGVKVHSNSTSIL
jgi:error-prone DNA polymerase